MVNGKMENGKMVNGKMEKMKVGVKTSHPAVGYINFHFSTLDPFWNGISKKTCRKVMI